MPTRRLLLGLALAGLALAALLAVRAALRARAPEPPAAAAPPRAERPAELPPLATEVPPPPEEEVALPDPDADAFEEAWSSVDLEAVRAALPDNSYWQRSAPTQDERVLREREDERVRRNDLYGKVLSGTGTEEDVRSYYADRQRYSTDAIQLVDYLLEHHEADLTERDQQFLQIARRLHLARLQEIPRRLEEGLARKRSQDEARAAWLADEARFRGDAPDGGPSANEDPAADPAAEAPPDGEP
jgi:hypothetical protein